MFLFVLSIYFFKILQPRLGSEALTNIEYTEKKQSMISKQILKIKKEVN
jgi:hypothetical protein